MFGSGGTIRTFEKISRPLYPEPKRVQQTIPIYKIRESGIFQIENGNGLLQYDKCYRFTDVNYADLDEKEKKEFGDRFQAFLNSMAIPFKIVIANHNADKQSFREHALLKEHAQYPELVQAYNEIIEGNLEASRNIEQEKYLVLSVWEQSVDNAKAYFDSIENHIKEQFGGMGSILTPLDSMERLFCLYRFYRKGKEGEFHIRKPDLLKGRDWVNDICPVCLKEEKSLLELDDRYVTTLFSRSFQPEVYDDFISAITGKPIHLLISVQASPIPDRVVNQMLRDRLQNVEMDMTRMQEQRNRQGVFSVDLPYDLRCKKEDIETLLNRIRYDNQHMFYIGVLVTITADTKEQLKKDAQTVISAAKSKGVTMETFLGRQILAMNSALPCGFWGVRILRDLMSECITAMMPFYVQELYDVPGIYYGRHQVSKHPIIGNRKHLDNGNGIFVGASGSGKSMELKQELTQVMLTTQDDIVVIDPLNEYFDICHQMGGQVVNLSTRSDDYMNPFDIPDRDSITNIDDFITEKIEFVLAICAKAVAPDPWKATYRSLITRCVKRLYNRVFYTEGDVVAPTFVDLYEEVLAQPEEEAKELALVLEAFTCGALSLFSHPTNVNINNRFVCYGIAQLGSEVRALGLLVMLENVRNRIISNAGIGRATWVYVDECHVILDDDYGMQSFDKLWREVRKQGGLMTGITQNLEDCMKNANTKTMLANSAFLIILNQKGIDIEKVREVLPVSTTQMDYITKATKGCGLMKFGDKIIPFDSVLPKDSRLYQMFNTNLHEKIETGQYERADR